MTKKTIIIGIAAAILLTVILLLVFNKGKLVISPRTEGVSILIEGKTYDKFPLTLKLKPGQYFIDVRKDGELGTRGVAEVARFKTTNYEPATSGVLLANYGDPLSMLGPVYSPLDESILYFYIPEKKFKKLPVYSSSSSEINQNAKDLSEKIEIDIDKEFVSVNWSPNKDKAVIFNGDKAILCDFNTKVSREINASSADFLSEDKIVYLAGGNQNSLFQSSSDGSGAQKLGDLDWKPDSISVSPIRKKIALFGKGLSIFDLDSNKAGDRIKKSVAKAAWQSDDLLAFTSLTDEEGINLNLLNLDGSNEILEFGKITNSNFIWFKGNHLVYVAEGEKNSILQSVDISTREKINIYDARAAEVINNLMVKDSNLIFSLDSTFLSLEL